MNQANSNYIMDENVLYSNFIKYDVLKEFTQQTLSYSSSDKLNIFIDLNSLLFPLYRYNARIHEYTGISAIIINLCAHLRYYYHNYHRVETRFYIINSYNAPVSARQFYSDYNYQVESITAESKQITKTIADNCGVLNILCPYLPDIFYIEDNNTEVSVIIHNLCAKFREKDPTIPNVVLTKDPYAYQLVAMNPDVVIFRPHKINGEDLSWYVTKDNLYNAYRVNEVKNQTEYENYSLSPELFSFVMSLTGFKCRKLYAIFNMNTSMKMLTKAVEQSKINNCYVSDVEYALKGIDYNRLKAPEYYIAERFKAIDLVFQHYIYMSCPTMHSNTSTIVNLYDPDEVRNINNTYFVSNPLDLNRL